MTKEELKTKIISAISLGCDKNKVDLENMLGRLKEYGFQISSDIDSADIVIVNTCAFIQSAQEEAIANILEMENLKKLGRLEKVIITGCFPERNYSVMKENFPEIDAFLHLRENENIVQIIEGLYGLTPTKPMKKFERVLTNSPSYAYLKIADGCNNACSYCTIPRIRGRYISYEPDKLVDEAKNLVSRGVQELILVAQDTTRYGEDLQEKTNLIDLCEKLSKIKNLHSIRFHYAYPEKVTDKLLDYITRNDKMCKYLDIPLQHIDNEILKSMRRRLDENGTRALIEKIKTLYPQISLRTSFIIGYPGETHKQFKKLCDFVRECKFDYAGFFIYSREPNTASYFMKKQVPNFIKKIRLNKITNLQKSIVQEKMRENIGKEVDVLVDYFDENTGEYCGHAQNMSPLVDFNVRFVDNGNINCCTYVKVKLYDFNGSDYKGEVV